MILAAILFAVILFGPNLWAARILKKFNYCRNDIPGTGGEFAEHLLKQLELEKCHVKLGDQKNIDHYNPKTKTVVLSKIYHESNSLTAIVIAAHEVGHAIQDAQGSKLLNLRTKLVILTDRFEKIASLLLFSAPILTLFFKVPMLGAATFLLAIAVMSSPIFIHLITLPVEYDASFNKAMPILKSGYLNNKDIGYSRKILTACTLTYLAASLVSLLNFYRWIRILKK